MNDDVDDNELQQFTFAYFNLQLYASKPKNNNVVLPCCAARLQATIVRLLCFINATKPSQ